MAAASRPPFERGAWLILVGAVLAIPLFYAAGKDPFRLPKDLLFRALMIVLTAATAINALQRRWGREAIAGAMRRRPVALACLAVVWTAVSALFAVNKILGAFALSWVVLFALFFVTAFLLAGDRTIAVLAAVIVPAIANALLALVQELGVWNPFVFPDNLHHHARTIGFLGNPDYVGVYLLVPALSCVTLFLIGVGNRVITAVAAIILMAGILASQSFTAIVALAMGALCVVVVTRHKWLALIAVAGVIAAIAMYPPVRNRFTSNLESVRNQEFDRFFSGRLGPYLAAIDMFRDHPLTGVGPGCFPYEFLTYRNEVQRREGIRLMIDAGGQNFGEVHNDQLQVLAETGAPGWIILAAAFAALAAVSWRRRTDDARQRFARAAALPLAVSTFIVTLGQFPLHLSAALVTDLFVFAIIMRWGELDS